MSQARFDQLVTLYRVIDIGDNPRRGVVTVADQQQKTQLVQLLAEGDDFGLRIVHGNADELNVGDIVELEIDDPKISIGIVASDIEDLLVAPKARIKELSRYFILDIKFCNSDAVLPEVIVKYRLLLKLIALLKSAAAYLDEENSELVFIDEGKFEVPIIYTSAEIQGIDQPALARLLEAFETDIHKEQRLAIIAKSIKSICSPVSPKSRFIFLLTHLPEVLKSFSEGYRLFVADFSYEKVINQLEVAKLEEIGKIHKTFADVQNQILGIPVATVIVATQMKSATSVEYQFWVNTAVLIGCWVFAVLSIFLLRNQLHTLNAIGTEIDRKKQQMLNEYKSVADLITKSFPLLEARLRSQRCAFLAVDIVLVIGLILSHVVYLVLTDPARAWVLNLLSRLCLS